MTDCTFHKFTLFLRYGDLVREPFGDVATAYTDNRHHVLEAVAWKPNLR